MTQMIVTNFGSRWLQAIVLSRTNIMGWPREVPPVCQQPLCSLPVLAVATVLDVGELWLYDQQLRRVVPVAEGPRCMAVLVGFKQLARIPGDDVPRRVTEVMLSLPNGDDNLAADARHTLDTLDLGPVVEAQSGGQRLVVASARSPGQARVDSMGEIVQEYGCRLLAGGPTESPGIAVATATLIPLGDSHFSSWRPRGTKRSRAYSVVLPLVQWRVRFSATMRPAMMHGTTCGLNAATAAVSHHG